MFAAPTTARPLPRFLHFRAGVIVPRKHIAPRNRRLRLVPIGQQLLLDFLPGRPRRHLHENNPKRGLFEVDSAQHTGLVALHVEAHEIDVAGAAGGAGFDARGSRHGVLEGDAVEGDLGFLAGLEPVVTVGDATGSGGENEAHGFPLVRDAGVDDVAGSVRTEPFDVFGISLDAGSLPTQARIQEKGVALRRVVMRRAIYVMPRPF
mmetsp:Transcript_29421/g.73887  ORF Transcript_29421/g.73887 Transcript_29421/m.73887 type:complete len:206 (+) Transcript_29421:2060-2677(+)